MMSDDVFRLVLLLVAVVFLLARCSTPAQCWLAQDAFTCQAIYERGK